MLACAPGARLTLSLGLAARVVELVFAVGTRASLQDFQLACGRFSRIELDTADGLDGDFSLFLITSPALFSSFFSKKENKTVRTVRHGDKPFCMCELTAGRCLPHDHPGPSEGHLNRHSIYT